VVRAEPPALRDPMADALTARLPHSFERPRAEQAANTADRRAAATLLNQHIKRSLRSRRTHPQSFHTSTKENQTVGQAKRTSVPNLAQAKEPIRRGAQNEEVRRSCSIFVRFLVCDWGNGPLLGVVLYFVVVFHPTSRLVEKATHLKNWLDTRRPCSSTPRERRS
jgi:hypothetical protein